MSIDTHSITGLLIWFWENAATAIWGGISLAVANRCLKRFQDWAVGLPTAIRNASRRSGNPVAYLRKLKLKDIRQIRRFRFNDMWIAREVSRGNAALILFGLSSGFWLMALGLKEQMVVSGQLLSTDATTVLISAFPAYVFEVMWLYRSSRANRLIDYRQKSKLWRFRR
jgi:hypothetical protein